MPGGPEMQPESARLPAPFLLEDWFREFYFRAPIRLCSSGVREYSLAEALDLIGLDAAELGRILIDDAPSAGSLIGRSAVATRYAGGNSDRVLLTHGSSEAIFLLLSTVLGPDCEAIVVDPAYQPLLVPPASTGAVVRRWKLRPEDGYVPDIATLRSLVTSRTRLIVANFPNNPTGATVDRASMSQIVEIAAEANSWLLWDMAFDDLFWTSEALGPPPAHERVLLVGTLSKAYGLPGLRFGWCIAPPDVLRDCIRVRDYVTLNLSPITERIGAAAVRSLEALVGGRREEARRNLGRLRWWSAEHLGTGDWIAPRGGVTAFPRLPMANTREFCRYLTQERGVLLVPGDVFGNADRVRIGFGVAPETFDLGLAALEEGLQRWRC